MVAHLLATVLLFLLVPTTHQGHQSPGRREAHAAIDDDNSPVNSTTTTSTDDASPPSMSDPRTERRLRERWDAFVRSRSSPVAIDPALSSPERVDAVAGKDLYLSCGLSRPLAGRLRISFLRLSDLNLLSVGRKMHTPDPRIEVLHSEVEAPR